MQALNLASSAPHTWSAVARPPPANHHSFPWAQAVRRLFCLCLFLMIASAMPLPDHSPDQASAPVDLRTVLIAVSAFLCVYAAWRLLNLTMSIWEEGMIPQLWGPVLSISAEVVLLLLCIGLLAARVAFVNWVGLAYAALWLVVLVPHLPVLLPAVLNSEASPGGGFSQAGLWRKLLVFESSMLVVASLLAWGLVVYARQLRRAR